MNDNHRETLKTRYRRWPPGVDIMTNDESKTGNLIIALGIVLLIVGIVVALIPRTERQCVSVLLVEVCENVTVFPYALIGWPIFIIGLILAIAGAVMIGSSRQSPQPQPQQPYYAQPVSPYPAQQQAPPQYAPQPYPQQQPAPIGTCGYCGRQFYYGETVCQGCRYALPRTQ